MKFRVVIAGNTIECKCKKEMIDLSREFKA